LSEMTRWCVALYSSAMAVSPLAQIGQHFGAEQLEALGGLRGLHRPKGEIGQEQAVPHYLLLLFDLADHRIRTPHDTVPVLHHAIPVEAPRAVDVGPGLVAPAPFRRHRGA